MPAAAVFDLYPFWAASSRNWSLRCSLLLNLRRHLGKGKRKLETEICYPMEVLIGHYQSSPKWSWIIFLSPGCDNGASSLGRKLVRAFLPSYTDRKGTVANSLQVDNEKILYAQLNYREGRQMIKPSWNRLPENYGKARPKDFENALDSGYGRELYQLSMLGGKPAGYGKDKG